ncbi:MAG: hypothetical protein Roseis2KO_30790 [Roseivirga sp.]
MIFLTVSLVASAQGEFVTVWETTGANQEIVIPTTGGGYNYTVSWGDGSSDTGQTGDATHSYNTAGRHLVKISGDFPRMYMIGSSFTNRTRLKEVKQWGYNVWQSMESAFSGTQSMSVTAQDSPNLTMVTSMESMFEDCDGLTFEDFTSWNTSDVTTFKSLFSKAGNFRGDVSTWNTSNVTDMSFTFEQATNFNGTIKAWDVSNVTTMEGMFAGVSSNNKNLFAGALDAWNVGNVTTMKDMFKNTNYNNDMSDWDVSKVTDMSGMFENGGINSDLSNWDVSNVSSMKNMFVGLRLFNLDLSTWDVGKVTDMSGMFSGTQRFNQDLSAWNTAFVTTMEDMFNGAVAFDQNLANFDISGATGLDDMLDNSGMSQANYDLTLAGWAGQTVQNGVTLGASGMEYCTSETERLSLINDDGWTIDDDNRTCNTTVTFTDIRVNEDGGAFEVSLTSSGFVDGGFSVEVSTADGSATVGTDYTAIVSEVINFAGAAGEVQTFSITPLADTEEESDETINLSMANLVTDGGLNNVNITDGGIVTLLDDETESSLFITTWTTTMANQEITIPAMGTGYDYQVDWGDGTVETNQTGTAVHAYNVAGDYQIKIIGSFPGIHLGEGTTENAARLKSIDQWGTNEWQSMEAAFSGAVNMVMTAMDEPNLNAVTSMKEMFKNCKAFDSPVSNWNTGNVQDMEGVFDGAESFNQFIGEWNTYNAVTSRRMFAGAKAFNQPLENWFSSDDRPISDMSEMFAGATAFNRPIDEWKVKTVTDMSGMFKNAEAFNRDLSAWEVPNVTDFSEMFSGATAFNQNLGNWDVSSASTMESMFESTAAFDQHISGWQVDQVTSMAAMFKNAAAFNQPLNDWDVSNVTTMAGMFEGATLFNQDMSDWQLTALRDISALFKDAKAFNQDLSDWETANITNMSEAFSNADAYDQDLSSWNVVAVTDMSGMFNQNDLFDQNLGSWDIGQVTTMANIFDGTPLSDENYDAMLTGWSAQTVQNGVVLGADGVKYCGSASERQSLMDDDSWSFVGDAAGCEGTVSVADARGNEDDGTITITLVLEEAIAGGFSVDLTTADGTATAGTDYTALTAETVTFAGTAGEVKTLTIPITQDSDNEADETITVNIDNLMTDASNSLIVPTSITATIVNDDDDAAFFIMTWETTVANEEMIIPTNGGGYDFRVDWGDGTVETHLTDDPKHTYENPGIHTVKIIGSFPWIFFSEQDEDGGDLGLKLRSVEQWGTNVWQSFEGAFEGASNMVVNATDAPDLSQVIRMDQMFSDCHALTDQDFSSWDVGNVQNMEELFTRTDNFNGNISSWNTANVTNMTQMFEAAKSFNGDLSAWNTNAVTSMEEMFKDALVFNKNLDSWNVSGVTNFSGMFEGAAVFNQGLNAWDVSKATTMRDMFRDAAAFNGDISLWDVSSVDDMDAMFRGAAVFNQDITAWNVAKVDDMEEMFRGAKLFDQDIGIWDVSSVVEMVAMFREADVFNQDISVWNVSAVEEGEEMFQDALVFNQDISGWDISGIDNLESMFDGAAAFDQNLGSWNVTEVDNMESMFNNAGMSQASYDATLIGWAAQDIQEEPTVGADGLKYCAGAEARTKLENDFGWDFEDDSQGCMATVTIADASANEDDGNLVFILELDKPVIDGFIVEVSTADGTATAGTDYTAITSRTVTFQGFAGEQIAVLVPLAADAIIEQDKTFTISAANLVTGAGNEVTITAQATGTILDDDDPADYFITTWETTRASETLTLTTVGEGYNFRIDWGDGTVEVNQSNSILHTYAAVGTYTVKIFGAFPRFSSTGARVVSIDQWGSNPWQSMEEAFVDQSLEITATDVPDLSNVTSLVNMFHGTDLGNADLTSWDVSTITDMSGLFSESGFDGDISNWDVSNVTNMTETFSGSDFNGDISGWDVSNVTDMTGTFSSTSNFDGDLTGWDVSNVTVMRSMFARAEAFNSDLSAWDVSNVVTMRGMFESTVLFNQDISVWDVSSVTDMTTMFQSAQAFNQPLNDWDVSSVTTMQQMFQQADAFNQDLNDWDVSNVELFDHMFKQTELFNGNISGWDVSSGWDFEEMFQETEAFNQPIGNWNLAGATRIRRMFQESEAFDQPLDNWRFPALLQLEQVFRKAEVFNQDLNSWEVGHIIAMQDLFEEAVMFNGDIIGWDVSNVVDFGSMLNETAFNQDISGWDVSSGEDFSSMFDESPDFNQDLSGWDMSNATTVSNMFDDATSFDQDLSSWQLTNVTSFGNMVRRSGLSVANYDALLISLAAQDVVGSVYFDVENLRYCAGDAARQSLINKGWDFRNDDTSCMAEVTIADVSGNEDDGSITVTLTLDSRVIDGFTLDVTTAAGTATAGTDFSGAGTQPLTFVGTAGETKTLSVTPIADTDDEEDETVLISMSNPVTAANNTITVTDQATVTILDDDNDPPVGTDVSISGLTQVGQTLTGSYSYTDDENDPENGTTFQWYTGNSAPPATVYNGTTLEDHEFQSATDRAGRNAFLNILDNVVYTEDFINGSADPVSSTVDVVFGLGIGFGLYPISYYDANVNGLAGFTTKNVTKMALTSLTATDLATIVTGEDVISLIEGEGLTLVEDRVELAGGSADGVGLVVAFELAEGRGGTRGLIEIASVNNTDQSLTVNVYIGASGNQLVPISEATTTTLTLTEDLIGENIIFGVTPANDISTGLETTSEAVGPVQGLPVTGFSETAARDPESTANASIQVNLDMAGLVASSVDYAITGTATGGTDYTLQAGTLSFAAGDVSENISLSIINDQIVEADETVIITLTNPSGLSLGTNTTFTYTIEDDDQATVSLAGFTADEGDGSLTITATLDNAVDGGFTVDLITAESSAIKGVDYIGLEDVTLTFAGTAGEIQAATITLVDDDIVEFQESISVLFDNLAATNLNVTTGDVVEVTITDNDQTTVTIADVAQFEDGESFLVTATLDKAVSGGFNVDVSTTDGTATEADGDYTALAGQTLTFTGTAGESQTFEISPGADSKLESNETFTVALSNLTGTTLPVTITDEATLTITNDDAAAITIADASGNEGDGPISVTATLDNEVQGDFTVDVSTADGTATIADSDYTALAGQTLTFTGTAGETQTFTVAPANDLVVEANETLTVAMSGLSTALAVDISNVATVTIINDDFNNAPTDITLSATSIAENNALDATIGSLTTTDADAGNTHSYGLVAGEGDEDNASFLIDGTTLKANNSSFNFEDRDSYSIRVQTDDGEGGTFQKAFTLSITNVNESPFAISLTNNTIDEADDAQEVGSLMSLDPDNGDSFTYSLVTGDGDVDNALFAISGSALRTAGAIDFEEADTRTIRVQVVDAGGLSFAQSFTIAIEDVVAEPVREFTTNVPGGDVKNVFSPNGDGVNETWVIEDLLDNPFNEVKIFAQGGKLIYSKENYTNDWAGTFRDEPVPDGTYYYEIIIFENAQSTTPARVIKGFLTIIRNR